MHTDSPESTVFVVDDDPAICKAVRWLLESVDLTVQTYEDPSTFLFHYKPTSRGCLLLDIRMPKMSGLELQEALIAKGNIMPIIFMSGHGDIPMAVRAMKGGAIDFITKPFNDQQLIELVQKALTFSPHSGKSADTAFYSDCYASLTEREREVMENVVAGKMNKVIAHDMGISIKTVELHRGNLMRKMQMKSVAELVKVYLQLKLPATELKRIL